MASAERPLNDEQRRFVEGLLSGLNGKTAYEKAGYKARGDAAEVNASRLLRDARIQAALLTGRQQAAEAVQITVQDVLTGLLTEARRMGKDSSPAARVAAWTQLGKHLGLFPNKLIHTGQIRHVLSAAELTEDELDAILAAGPLPGSCPGKETPALCPPDPA